MLGVARLSESGHEERPTQRVGLRSESAPMSKPKQPGADLDQTKLLALYRQMQTIRQCEEELARCHQRGLIHGACHTYVGQEAVAVGVCSRLRQDDVIFSTHRGHGHALAKGL